jgi:sulfoxide reductase heme-binding subunit YedZ
MDRSSKEVALIWLKSNWRWTAFNLFAACVSVYVIRQGRTGWENLDTFDTGLESGKWAIRFLLTSLSMTPLNTYFGWRPGIKLRKSAGLWAFGFASLHVLFYIRETKFQWLSMSMPLYLFLGLTGMTILTVLACTSNRWSMKSLGKNWKRLHRLVYGAGAAVVTHSLLATTMSKKVMIRDPESASELKIYIAIAAILLVVRLPIVRQLLLGIPIFLERSVKSKVFPQPEHDPVIEVLPTVQGRESSVSVKPTFVISNTISNLSRENNVRELTDTSELPLEEEIEAQ